MRKNRHSSKSINYINVTPIVDVMLVLLIIFMITSPILINGVEVNLPKADTKTLQSAENPLIVTLNAKHKIFIQETEFSKVNLQKKIFNLAQQDKNLTIYIKGDKNIDYGSMMELMSILYKSGAKNLSLISDLETK